MKIALNVDYTQNRNIIFSTKYKKYLTKKMIGKLTCLLLVFTYLSVCTQNRLLKAWDDPNCSIWSQDGMTCLQCSLRAYYNQASQKCVQVDDLCKTWDQTNGDCLTCYDGYGDSQRDGNAISGACPLWNTNNTISSQNFVYDINCKCYSDSRQCIQCYQRYFLDEMGICEPFPVGCAVVENFTCVQCLPQYYMNMSGVCTQLPANCLSADQNGQCTQCQTGYQLFTQENECILLPANCLKVNINGSCQQCNKNYYLDEQLDCNLLGANCIATDNQGKCTQCEIGYFLDSQLQCEILPENCFFTDDNGICTQCNDGYYLDRNKECQLLPENCLRANRNGRCIDCKDGFKLTRGECFKGIIGGPNLDCLEQNNQSQCTKCRSFYDLVDGQCVPTGENPYCKPGACQCGTGKCLQCMTGYFMDNNGICQPISQNCQQFSKQTGLCTSCIENYTLSSGECIPTVQQIIVNLNCQQQTDNGTCTSCRKYYMLQNGDCIPTGKNPKCRIWNKDETVCYCCYYHDLYYLDNNGVCSRKNKDCKQFNPQNGECTECEEGWNLQEGKCVEDLSQPQASQKIKPKKKK